MFSLDIVASESKKFIFVESGSKTTDFVFYLDISKPEDGLVVWMALTHQQVIVGIIFFIKRRSEECYNSELLACPLDNTSATTVLLPHRPR